MRIREILHAKFLANWLNDKFGTDYSVNEDLEGEDTDVDIKLLSKGLVLFEIQNVAYRAKHSDKKALHRRAKTYINGVLQPKAKFTMVIGFAMEDNEIEQSLKGCIKEKESKYSSDRVKQIILLVELTIPTVTIEDLDRLKSNFQTKFKALYFVCLPHATTNGYKPEGFVYEFKGIQNSKDGPC